MEVRDWLSQLGFKVDAILFDGQIHRVATSKNPKKTNGWYVGYEAPTKILIAGDWSKSSIKHVWRQNGKTSLPREMRDKINEQIKLAKEKALRDRENAQLKARTTEKSRWEWCEKQNVQHPYLDRKKIQGKTVGTHEGCLYVPMTDEHGQLWNLQKIFADGQKLFPKGGRVKGLWHKIPGDESRIFICEGYATGAAINHVTGHLVFCAFSAFNMTEIAPTVRQLFPEAAIAIAADNDQFTENNPGVEAAKQAAKLADASVIIPQFKSLENKPTDFNDLFISEGPDAVKSQLDGNTDSEKHMTALGMRGNHSFMFNHQSGELVELSGYSTIQFYKLGSREYWANKYPGEKELVDWEQAKSDIIQLNKKVGRFDESRVRGSGVWIDEGRTVINLGDGILVNGSQINSSRLRSNYVYSANDKKVQAPGNQVAANFKDLIELVNGISWVNPSSAMYLLGWVVIAPLAGALPIRPHLHITGRSGVGKTTVQDEIIRKLLPAHYYFKGSTTEAGMRQSIENSALPVVFDEFEATEHDLIRVQSVIELFRQSFDASGSRIVKGSQTGVAQIYSVNFCGIVSSIRINMTEEADLSRFTILEIGKDPDRWNKSKHLLKSIDRYRDSIWSRSVVMLPQILENSEIIYDVMPDKYTDREKRKFALLLAGYQALISTEKISDPKELIQAGAIEQDLGNEAIDCLNKLLTSTVRVPVADGKGETTMTVGFALASVAKNIPDALKHHGLDVVGNALLISNTHDFIQRVYRGTKWANSFVQVLRRNEGASNFNNKAHRFRDSKTKVTAIPIELLN